MKKRKSRKKGKKKVPPPVIRKATVIDNHTLAQPTKARSNKLAAATPKPITIMNMRDFLTSYPLFVKWSARKPLSVRVNAENICGSPDQMPRTCIRGVNHFFCLDIHLEHFFRMMEYFRGSYIFVFYRYSFAIKLLKSIFYDILLVPDITLANRQNTNIFKKFVKISTNFQIVAHRPFTVAIICE